MRAQLVVDCRDALGEGVFWSAQHGLVYWTDIYGKRVWTYDPVRDDAKSWPAPGRLCSFSTRAGQPWHKVVAAFDDGFAFFDLVSGERTQIARIDADLPTVRMNDGRTDRQGRFIAGGMDEKSLAPIASVWRLDPDLTVTRLFGSVGCANGTCFSRDGRTLWFADSSKGAIEAFDYDTALGTADRRRLVATIEPPAVPDGSCIDAEGFIWNAAWEGYRVARFSPDGKRDMVIDVPCKKPTCCAFGGSDLATLYITSSRDGESDAVLAREPLAGGLFAVRPGVRGLVDTPFAG